MNQTHTLVFTKKNNTLYPIEKKESQYMNYLSYASLEALSHNWHTKNNIQIVIDDIAYHFKVYDYLVLSEKFQKVSKLITAEEMGEVRRLKNSINSILSQYEKEPISPKFFKDFLRRIEYDLFKNKELNQNFLFLNRLLEIMPNRFSKTAEETARDFLSLEKNLDKKIDLIRNSPSSSLHNKFNHYQNLLDSWDKLINKDYIKLGYSKEDIAEDGSLSEDKMRERTSILKP